MTHIFQPIVRNAHLLTIAGNFWPRQIDLHRFPCQRKLYRTDDRTTVVVYEHQPPVAPRGQIIVLHGLEGSADAGYIQSFAQAALEHGFGVHRKNMRSCGGTEDLSETMYHSGLTADTRFIARALHDRNIGPVFAAGFSLGGNVVLKLAGELGETALLAGVCAVSTPIDLAMSVAALDNRLNFLYRRRFLDRLRKRVVRKSMSSPDTYKTDRLAHIHSIYDFDNEFTAPLFGFGTAANYYATQSSARFLSQIRTPTLVIAAQDDPLVPFRMYRDHPAFSENPALTLVAPEHGGHIGFLSRGFRSRTQPRFWVDQVAIDWLELVAGRASRRETALAQ